MTLFHLVRHGLADVAPNVLAGTIPGIGLHDIGEQQVRRLLPVLARTRPQRLYASPLERTQQTARILGDGLGLEIITAESLREVDFGEWSGKPFADFENTVEWSRFANFRSATAAPGGEYLLELQGRAVHFLLQLRDAAPSETILIVTHGDVVRALAAYFLGIPLDLLSRLQIHPASLSTLQLTESTAELLHMNWTPDPTDA